MFVVKQSETAYALLFPMTSSADHISPATGLSPTVTIAKNGAAFASPAGTVAEIGSGWYKVTPTSADTGTLGSLILHATASGADPTDAVFVVVGYDPADGTRLGLATLPNVATGAVGGLPLATTSAGQVQLDWSQAMPTTAAPGTLGRFCRSLWARLIGKATESGTTVTYSDWQATPQTAVTQTYDSLSSPTTRNGYTES